MKLNSWNFKTLIKISLRRKLFTQHNLAELLKIFSNIETRSTAAYMVKAMPSGAKVKYTTRRYRYSPSLRNKFSPSFPFFWICKLYLFCLSNGLFYVGLFSFLPARIRARRNALFTYTRTFNGNKWIFTFSDELQRFAWFYVLYLFALNLRVEIYYCVSCEMKRWNRYVG